MKLQFSLLAQQDIDAIFHYISDTLHNHTAASNTLNSIIHVSERISNFPRLGPVIHLVNSSNIEVRYVISGSYLVAYVIEPTHIEVIRVLYARSDYVRLLDT